MEDLRKLYRLHDLSGYKVASNYADVRGWKVIDADNRTIGKVEDLLVNKHEERVIYLDVEADSQVINAHDTAMPGHNGRDEDHLLIPIGAVSFNTKEKYVLCNKISFEAFTRVKRFKKGIDINRDYEIGSFYAYYPGEERYGSHDDENFYRRSQFERHEY